MEGWSGRAYRVLGQRNPASATVFSSPHSGRRYPDALLLRSRLSGPDLRASEDGFVDDLFSSAAEFGATLIAAEFPRAFVDVNRSEDELDPMLIARLSSKRPKTLRVSAGLGVVPRVVAEGAPIYSHKLKLAEVEQRIEQCHRPYHVALQERLEHCRGLHGMALLIDCHSMPSAHPRARTRGTDIVIGDCYGASASPEISEAVFGLFRNAGFSVARNAPFAGGFITQRYGRPEQNMHAVQIEIDRGLYMDQRRVEPSSQFDQFQSSLRPIISALCDLPNLYSTALAAE